jgi:DNA-binding transcriptional LysR family regulator
MSEQTHPGSRDWLSGLCEQAGFTPRILQDVEMESGIMTFVAEGLGVTLAREQISHLPHPGAVFRPLTEAVKADYWIAWHRENRSKVLCQYVKIAREAAAGPH